MRTSRRTTLTTVAVAALAATVLTGAPAAADGSTVLRSGFAGNVPLTAPHPTPVIGGVNPAGRGWILDDSSRVRVREDGRITVRIRGLIFDNGDPNVVPAVVASLVCGGTAGTVVDTTEAFDLSIPAGHARTRQHIDVPADCDDPIVLVRNATSPGGGPGGYFAFTTETED